MLYMECVCIRNVDDETWNSIKADALKHDMNIGDYIKFLFAQHTAQESNNWDKILYGKRHVKLSNHEWNQIKKTTAEDRKRFKFREFL